MNLLYRILSALLSYPDEALLKALPGISAALKAYPAAEKRLAPLIDYLSDDEGLIALQMNYVTLFDRVPAQSLHLFEHIHGESRERGPAMADLLSEYQQRGFEPQANELPDYLPLFLEFLGQLPNQEIPAFIDDAIHVIAAIGKRLQKTGSPYVAVFDTLQTLSDVDPQPLTEPPVHDIDEMLETFGPGPDGVEPLLKPVTTQPVTFHPRGATA